MNILKDSKFLKWMKDTELFRNNYKEFDNTYGTFETKYLIMRKTASKIEPLYDQVTDCEYDSKEEALGKVKELNFLSGSEDFYTVGVRSYKKGRVENRTLAQRKQENGIHYKRKNEESEWVEYNAAEEMLSFIRNITKDIEDDKSTKKRKWFTRRNK